MLRRMSNRFSWRYMAVSVFTGLCVGVFAVTLARATLFPQQEAESATPPKVAAQALPGQYPARLRIPSIGVNAAVDPVGIAHSGAMMPPPNFTDVGWYKWGPVPGQTGSAVIDGHVDNGLSLAGVFKHLSDVKVGDDLYVDTKDGTTLHFRVADIEIYPYQSAPTALIFGRSDKPRLNLITCDGQWVKGGHTYNERLVIYGELAS